MLVVGFERDMNTSRAQSTLPLAAGSNNVEHAPATPTLHAPAAGAVPVVSQPSTGGVETFRAGRSRGKTELNVERLTEQVSRHLARRLLIERERRGLGRK
jgi:hypothetical protein